MMTDITTPNQNGTTTQNTAPQRSTAPGEVTLQAKIWSPFRVYFDGKAKSVSAVNKTGPFDILPHHHNFITLLDACDLVLDTAGGETRIKISGGVMHVHQNAVTVFLEV